MTESAGFKRVKKLMSQGLSCKSCELVCGMWARDRNLTFKVVVRIINKEMGLVDN